MTISVINHTKDLKDEEVQRVIRAINRQIREDFEPYWSLGATLRLEGKTGHKPGKMSLADMRGDAVLYLWDDLNMDDAVGYHDTNNRGIPFGFVFTALAKEIGDSWTATFSHEALELIGDPEVNLLSMGPHPKYPERNVFHWYEMCDAVQSESYKMDGVEVSNFVLPLYFTSSDEVGGRNDFLGRSYRGRTLTSFGVNPGGYVNFFDPELGVDDTYSHPGDKRAAKVMRVKAKAHEGRRGGRHAVGQPPAPGAVKGKGQRAR